jgi:hypothetical protein
VETERSHIGVDKSTLRHMNREIDLLLAHDTGRVVVEVDTQYVSAETDNSTSVPVDGGRHHRRRVLAGSHASVPTQSCSGFLLWVSISFRWLKRSECVSKDWLHVGGEQCDKNQWMDIVQ